MLQGPHGPFFRQLADRLRAAGGDTLRITFNGGDAAMWWPRRDALAYRGTSGEWPETFARIAADWGATDLVVYGDSRPLHAGALARARAAGITTHIFEEGYLRPWWITYEREATNGASPLVGIGPERIPAFDPAREPPGRAHDWGDLRQHRFWGALYHTALLAGRPFYPGYEGHRGIPVAREAALNLARLALLPRDALRRRRATRRLKTSGAPYHLVLLQLEHDSSFRDHGPFATTAEFMETVARGFATGAPVHHHLVFKAHPLEDGRAGLFAAFRAMTRAYGLTGRAHLISGGKLAALLDDAQSAVTVNSTAGQQALLRGLPLKAFGRAAYSGRGFTSAQPLPSFFAAPDRPDLAAYRAFRRFMLETCQLEGGYYAARGRARALRRATDMVLAAEDSYSRALDAEAHSQHLGLMPATGA